MQERRILTLDDYKKDGYISASDLQVGDIIVSCIMFPDHYYYYSTNNSYTEGNTNTKIKMRPNFVNVNSDITNEIISVTPIIKNTSYSTYNDLHCIIYTPNWSSSTYRFCFFDDISEKAFNSGEKTYTFDSYVDVNYYSKYGFIPGYSIVRNVNNKESLSFQNLWINLNRDASYPYICINTASNPGIGTNIFQTNGLESMDKYIEEI